MNKFSKFLMTLLVVSAASFGFVSCSDDDGNGGSLEAPRYEGVSARYDITSAGSDINSIELTSSGNYIIIKNSYSPYGASASAEKRTARFVPKWKRVETRAGVDDIIYGKFTKISDTEFDLEGYGKIVVTGAADNATSLEITPIGEKPFTLTAEKVETNLASSQTDKLCRTWTFASIRVSLKVMGKKIFDKEYPMDKLDNYAKDVIALLKKYNPDFSDEDAEYIEDEVDFGAIEDFPSEVIFTKAGTYMVVYTNENLAVARWQWEDEKDNVLRYSWDYDDMYEDYASGYVSVGFRGAQLSIKEAIGYGYDDEYDEEDGSVTVTSYLDEVKY